VEAQRQGKGGGQDKKSSPRWPHRCERSVRVALFRPHFLPFDNQIKRDDVTPLSPHTTPAALIPYYTCCICCMRALPKTRIKRAAPPLPQLVRPDYQTHSPHRLFFILWSSHIDIQPTAWPLLPVTRQALAIRRQPHCQLAAVCCLAPCGGGR
jgi:hypothetical protein